MRMPRSPGGRAAGRARARRVEETEKSSREEARGQGGGRTAATAGHRHGDLPGGQAAAGAKTPQPDLPGRIDGLRGWLGQIERRQARMTYVAAAGLLIALAAAGVALYLGITNNQDRRPRTTSTRSRTGNSRKVRTESQARHPDPDQGPLTDHDHRPAEAESRPPATRAAGQTAAASPRPRAR